MARFTDTDLINAFNADQFKFCNLYQIGKSASQLLLTDNDSTVSAGALTYTSSRVTLENTDVTETSMPTVGGIDITFSAVDRTMVSYFLNADHVGLPLTILRAVVGTDNSITGQFNLFKGQISSFTILDDENTSQIEVKCKSHWADFEKNNGRRTNHNSQQLLFAGDNGFEFAAKSIDNIKWGKK